MNKVVFLDRDGTINEDYGYVCKIEDWKFKENVIEGLKLMQDLGFKLIVISNQSAIARGYCKKEDVEKIFDYMKEELKKSNIEIEDIYYCPHLNEECECRKPKLGLFYKAIKEHNIDLKKSYAIGDKLRDLSICEKENVKGFLIDENYKEDKVYNKNITICKDLLEAAKKIYEEEKDE